MPKVVVFLQETEFNALQQLAQKEYRTAKAQAALMLRDELKRVGSVKPVDGETQHQEPRQSSPAGGK
jgi:hypothetical protein